MGCDIHVYTEVKKHVNSQEVWFNADYWQHNPYYDPNEKDGERPLDLVSAYHGRNYDLFAILADVRNEGLIEPMCEPKGLPDNVSVHTKEEADRWDGDGHSHSYFTLHELKEYLKAHPKTKCCGFMPQREADKVDRGEYPDFWCGWADEAMKYVYREWEMESQLTYFVKKLHERMVQELNWGHEFKEDEDTTEFDQKFRIVFWFDN